MAGAIKYQNDNEKKIEVLEFIGRKFNYCLMFDCYHFTITFQKMSIKFTHKMHNMN